MNKYLFTAIFLVLLMSPLSHAGQVVHDGLWWKTMGHIAKDYSLEGFSIGVREAANNKKYKRLEKKSFAKIIDGLDLFYKNPQNIEVRFHVAVFIVLHKIKGASIKKVKQLSELARQNPTIIPKTRN